MAAGAGGEVVVKYVGHKIAKTRWSPLQQGSIATSDTFATGGWDDEVEFDLGKEYFVR